jgi:adenine-specific DNA methylase
MLLFDLEDIDIVAKFPTTRYQGSKQKYADWIWSCIQHIPFETVLDAFGGTGCIAHLLKQEGKTVAYNDILKFNSIIGKALIENDREIITDKDLFFILHKHKDVSYPNFIEKTFPEIYFTDEENRWLDVVITNIRRIENKYKQAIAYFALFQSCIIKRPYNLFHRKNLYVRMQDVKRSFGNKATWDTPFVTHYKNFIEEANNAVFSNGKNNISLNSNVFNLSEKYDLVYIDTPYISEKGVGVDYLDFYHFLEGVVNYDNWGDLIDEKSKHKRLQLNGSDWTKSQKIEHSFERLIKQFQDSTLVISYRSDGIPSIEKIVGFLEANNKSVTISESRVMKYVLSTKKSTEVLIIGQ